MPTPNGTEGRYRISFGSHTHMLVRSYDHHQKLRWKRSKRTVQIGLRPYYLVQDMDESRLKRKLERCSKRRFKRTDFSIGHRGAALQFPEHTKDSYEAAARMGAGILECDVTFTQDRELVCRHSQYDLHTTTNILLIPELAAKCSEPFTPAEFDPVTGELVKSAAVLFFSPKLAQNFIPMGEEHHNLRIFIRNKTFY